MMLQKRLIEMVPEAKKHIAANVFLQWLSLLANIALTACVCVFLAGLVTGAALPAVPTALFCFAMAAIRFLCMRAASWQGYLSCRRVKHTLREAIYQKLLRLGPSYAQSTATSEIVQVACEGVEQLETYFSAYLPQLFYSLLAPITLFAVLSFFYFPAALILFICVPLIPISIALVQTFAKKLLAKYWGQYTALGDHFLENLQGLTTLKIYQTDGERHAQMNEQAEHFRRITMKVLTMQLNSITIMDLVAFGGSAAGIILAIRAYAASEIGFAACLLMILLSAEFFLPMRLLGSFFHIAMNGMAASDKIFRLLGLEEPEQKNSDVRLQDTALHFSHVGFSYDGQRNILSDVSLSIPANEMTALVGKSGCGKSTVCALAAGTREGYTGSITLGGVELSALPRDVLMRTVTTVGSSVHLFKGSVRSNLLMAKPDADDAALWAVLERVALADFLRSEQGLDTTVLERGENFSGGQRQRLALARALLHDTPVYIFDEATSNIDVESEDIIMQEIRRMAHQKTVLFISHRLANVTCADNIYAFENGEIKESGSHEELLGHDGPYRRLWTLQKQLEEVGKEKQQ
ncbi:MAG TPA: ABC transporter ATP-binding protein/permease [Candidatus Ruthenibacterium avium]|uniref:ABC transporter ATP-binding protein/permease n=1 Tax=Candidatus Ruthenibacterium avium TaxID=2838751 RepID=A0A9D2M0B7_9FIRM|nr:ABC transporter ATP-binding protein/permease [Candidatus Ruthenibacterium avium]